MSDRRRDELKARLGDIVGGREARDRVAVGEVPGRMTVSSGGFGWGIWLMRGAALLFAGVFTLLAPVVTFDCAVATAGAATCTFVTSTAGVRPLASERFDGVVRAETTPDGSGIRLLGRNEVVLYERSDSALAGTSMRSLAQRLQAAIDGPGGTTVRGWQWPLPIAILCAVALLFAASGLIPLLGWARRAVFGAPSPEAAARASASGATWAFALIACGVGFGILYLAPVVSYRCATGDGGASCVVERRYLGLAALERIEVGRIARADASAYTRVQRERDPSTNRRRESTESISTVSFQSADGKLLFEDEQSGAVGTSARDIADAVSRLAGGDEPAGAVHVWQMPWIPALLGSLGLLFGVPTLLAVAVGPFLGARGRAVLGTGALVGMLLALAAGWTLALLGRMPG